MIIKYKINYCIPLCLLIAVGIQASQLNPLATQVSGNLILVGAESPEDVYAQLKLSTKKLKQQCKAEDKINYILYREYKALQKENLIVQDRLDQALHLPESIAFMNDQACIVAESKRIQFQIAEFESANALWQKSCDNLADVRTKMVENRSTIMVASLLLGATFACMNLLSRSNKR